MTQTQAPTNPPLTDTVKRKHITVVTPCYNEESNVIPLCEALVEVFKQFPQYTFDHLFIDNRSKDNTRQNLRQLAAKYPHVKVIFNTRNFGHIRSPYYALLQAQGDAVMLMASDFQDPPAMLGDMIKKWEEGYKIAIGVKVESEESVVMYTLRTFYYTLVRKLADVELLSHVTGFGIYDRSFLEVLRKIDEPYPYFRGLITEIGMETAQIHYKQSKRKAGLTKNNFYTLYDIAMLGITSHSKVPLRLATMAGMLMAIFSLFIAFVFFVAKLVFWNTFTIGIAPMLISMYFFASVQLFFIGVLGEYIAAIHTQILKRPLVVESERLNFEHPPGAGLSVEPGTAPTQAP